jgi:hypothetical protein
MILVGFFIFADQLITGRFVKGEMGPTRQVLLGDIQFVLQRLKDPEMGRCAGMRGTDQGQLLLCDFEGL